MRISSLVLSLATLLGLAACTSTPVEVAESRQDVICTWGEDQFDLCRFDSQEAMVEALLAEMTLDEKIGQMTMSIWHNNVTPEVIRDENIGAIIHTEGPVPGPKPADWVAKLDEFQQRALETRLGIPLLIGVDAVHGQNTFEGAVIFPHNIGMGATRNMDLVRQAAEITAIEVAGTGFNWTFSPCIATPQHEHWGRVYEGFTEDRDLTVRATIAAVRGCRIMWNRSRTSPSTWRSSHCRSIFQSMIWRAVATQRSIRGTAVHSQHGVGGYIALFPPAHRISPRARRRQQRAGDVCYFRLRNTVARRADARMHESRSMALICLHIVD